RYGGSARSGGRHKTNGMVVPIDDPCALHCPPAETSDLKLNGCSYGSGQRTHLETLRHFDSILCHRLPLDDARHLVDSAVVFRNDEAPIEPTAGIDVDAAERRRGLRVFFALEMVIVFDHPAARHCSPLKLRGLPRRQISSHHAYLGSDNNRLVVFEI